VEQRDCVPLLTAAPAGAAVAVALGVYGRHHNPAGEALFKLGFSGTINMKAWLATIVLALVIVQVLLALWMYGKLGRSGAGVGRTDAPARRHARLPRESPRRVPLSLVARLRVAPRPRAPILAFAVRLRVLRRLHRQGAGRAVESHAWLDPAGRRRAHVLLLVGLWLTSAL
jgi:hypothetical protein